MPRKSQTRSAPCRLPAILAFGTLNGRRPRDSPVSPRRPVVAALGCQFRSLVLLWLASLFITIAVVRLKASIATVITFDYCRTYHCCCGPSAHPPGGCRGRLVVAVAATWSRPPSAVSQPESARVETRQPCWRAATSSGPWVCREANFASECIKLCSREQVAGFISRVLSLRERTTHRLGDYTCAASGYHADTIAVQKDAASPALTVGAVWGLVTTQVREQCHGERILFNGIIKDHV